MEENKDMQFTYKLKGNTNKHGSYIHGLKKASAVIFYTIGMSALIACSSADGKSEVNNNTLLVSANSNVSTLEATAAQNKTISLVVLNDLHAHLTSHVDVKRTANNTSAATKRGGVARIATEIKRIRAENPATAFMNIGDTFHGGVEAFYTEGNDIVTVVNMLGIDIGVPGNWDFAYGPNVTRSRFTDDNFFSRVKNIEQPNYPNLAANVKNTIRRFRSETLLPPTFSMNLDGVEVGFIGITSDIVPRMHPSLAIGMDFLQGEDNYRVLINQLATELRNKANPAQVVVVMSELGIHKDKQLADVIDSGLVDMFFSAHTHELIEAPLPSVSGALVVEAGNDTYLGRMDIELDQNNLIVARNWKIIPIEFSIAEDSAVKAEIENVRAKYLVANPNLTNPSPSSNQTLTQSIATVLVTTPNMIERHHALENPFNNLMDDMIKKVAGTQAAFGRGFRFSSHIPAKDSVTYEDNTVATGEVTIEDVYRFVPVPYTLSTASVSGWRIKEIIEQNLTEVFSNDRFLHVGGWFDGYAGLSIDLDLAQPDGQRLLGLSVYNNDGSLTPLLDQDTLTITGCSRPAETDQTALCAYTGFSNVTALINNNVSPAIPYTAIDFLIYALQEPTIFDPNSLLRKDISDSNNTPFWPVVEFVQPINGVP